MRMRIGICGVIEEGLHLCSETHAGGVVAAGRVAMCLGKWTHHESIGQDRFVQQTTFLKT